MSRWTGWRKGEPSDLRSHSEHALINSGPPTTLLLFKAKRQVHPQAKSTAQSANREKSPKLAFEPRRDRFSGGLGVPDSGQMGVFHAEKRRILKTEDSLTEGVGFEPTSDFRRCRFSSALLSVMAPARQCQRV